MFIEVIILNKTIDIIKKTEQDGDTIISDAKEQISKIKEELSLEIKNAENRYYNQINDLRDKLQKEEKDGIIRQRELLNENFIEETNSMRKSFLAIKEDLIQLLSGKVMS